MNRQKTLGQFMQSEHQKTLNQFFIQAQNDQSVLKASVQTEFICPQCLKVLPRTEFYIHDGDLKPYVKYCRSCWNVYKKEKRHNHHFKIHAPKDLKTLANSLISQIESKIAQFESISAFREEISRIKNNGEDINIAGFTKYLGAGIHRGCWLHKSGKIVIKIQFADSNDGNNAEIENWLNKDIPQEIKRHLVPILAYAKNGLWIIMPKAQTRNDDLDYHILSNIERNMENLFSHNKLHYGDIHNGNIGLIGKTGVIIDYGFLFEQKE